MIRIRPYLAGAIAVGLLLTAAAQTRKSAPKPAVKKSATAKKKSGTTKKKTSASRGRASKTRKAAPAPRGQQRPTPERYREIEEALAARGYLSEEPSGKWTDASVEALKSFQADNELTPTGRLDALSLIRLGLGPKE